MLLMMLMVIMMMLMMLCWKTCFWCRSRKCVQVACSKLAAARQQDRQNTHANRQRWEREREKSEEKNTGAAALWCKESCHGENLIKIFAHPPSEKLPRRLELPGTPDSDSDSDSDTDCDAKANARVAESANRSSQSQVIAVFSCNSFWGYLVHVETSQTSFETGTKDWWCLIFPARRDDAAFPTALSFLEQLSSPESVFDNYLPFAAVLTVNLCQANRERGRERWQLHPPQLPHMPQHICLL